MKLVNSEFLMNSSEYGLSWIRIYRNLLPWKNWWKTVTVNWCSIRRIQWILCRFQQGFFEMKRTWQATWVFILQYPSHHFAKKSPLSWNLAGHHTGAGFVKDFLKEFIAETNSKMNSSIHSPLNWIQQQFGDSGLTEFSKKPVHQTKNQKNLRAKWILLNYFAELMTGYGINLHYNCF